MEKIYSVAYLSADEDGSIIKTIDVLATNESEAIQKVVEVRNSADVYGVGNVKTKLNELKSE